MSGMASTPPADGQAKKKRFTRNPTRSYQPGGNWTGLASSQVDLAPFFTWFDVPRMLRDPRVRLTERMWRAPFQRVKWQVKANSPQVARFVGTTLRRFWRGSLPKILSRYFRYGFAPAGAEYRVQRGSLRLDRVRAIEPTDAQPLVWRTGADAGQPAGFRISRSGGGGMIPPGADVDGQWVGPPHAMWFAGYGEFSPWYDMPPMAGMFEPWLEKRGRNGAIHIRRGWYRKCAYRGGKLHHPDGTTNMGTDENPQEMDNQDIARSTLEYSETGAVYTFTNEPNPGLPGTYAWDFEEPAAQPDVNGIREYPQDLDAEMLEGAGIPPEVLEAADVGSGWSGRLIPLMGFLGGVDELAGLAIESADVGWMRHLVRVNFGPSAWYEIEPQSLAEEVQKQAQGGKDGGEGENPIPGLMGGGSGGEQDRQQPKQMSWTSYTGTHGGKGWKNDSTGEVRYQDNSPADDRDSPEPADEHHGKVRQILRTFRNLPKRAVKKARDKVTTTYQKLEQRYGPGYAKLIVGAGIASLPVPIPGAAVAFAAPMLAVAELHKRLAKWNAAPPANVDTEGIVKPAARSFLAQVFGKLRGALHLSTLDASPAKIATAVVQVPTTRIVADPARFQFRHDHDAEDGTVRELPSAVFDPEKCKALLLWADPADGLDYVVDGHHRLAWAERDGAKRVPARFIQAATAEEAKKIGEDANKARDLSATQDPPESASPHAEELLLAMVLAAEQGDSESLANLGELADDDDAVEGILGDSEDDDTKPEVRELSWVEGVSRGSGKRKAVGQGEHAGKTLYGKQAEAVLGSKEPKAKQPTAADRRKAEAAAKLKAKQDAAKVATDAAKKAVTQPKTLKPSELMALPGYLKMLTKPQLVEFARQVKEKVGGDKTTLAERLLAYAKTGKVQSRATINKPQGIDYRHKDPDNPVVKSLRANPQAEAALRAVMGHAEAHKIKLAATTARCDSLDGEARRLTNKARPSAADRARLAAVEAEREAAYAEFRTLRTPDGRGRDAALASLRAALKTESMLGVEAHELPTQHTYQGSVALPIPNQATPEGLHIRQNISKALNFVTASLSHHHLKVLHAVAESGRAWCGRHNTDMAVVANAASDRPGRGVDVVSVHEMGHAIERHKPGVLGAAREFLAYRVGDESPVSLKEAIGGDYGDGETGRKDDFGRAFGPSAAYYVGKSYPDDTEVVSMGLDLMYSDPVHFAAADPEYFQFIAHVLSAPATGKASDNKSPIQGG